VIVGDERIGEEEVEHVALDRGVRPRLFLEEPDRGLIAVERGPQLALADEGPGPKRRVALLARVLADAGAFGRGGLELLFVDELVDGLTGGLAADLIGLSHGGLLSL